MTAFRRTAVILTLGASLLAGHSRAAVDMDAVLEAEYRGIEAAMCPSAASPAGDSGPMDDYARHRVAPRKVFDNFYYIGMDNISAWALTTSEGIILFDAMMVANWELTIVDGLETLGLDPSDIKYIVIGHAHNDHWGGSSFLQQRYGAQILMGEPDWDHILTWPQIGTAAPIPNKDRGIVNGDTLTLGETTVRFVATPGHTPGTMSSLIPVKDGDGTFVKRDALDDRSARDPHPFVTGNAGIRQWAAVLRECTREVLSDKRSAL
jgi:glyoxylase-like metal-dependent hydrolase (beta-lactamase superfamily II)